MIIMKFGGSSVGSGRKIQHVANIVEKFRKTDDVIVVVSAMYKVTDSLISIFNKYKAKDTENASQELNQLFIFHKNTLKELGLQRNIHLDGEKYLFDLYTFLRNYLEQKKTYSKIDYEYVITYGERFSSYLLAAALNKINYPARAINASEVIILQAFSHPKVLFEDTQSNAHKLLMPLVRKKIIPIITGFFAATKNGTIVSLGRGGSDYSATILAHVLDANQVILWKEVDGIYNCDPKINHHAKFYYQLSYDDALRLAQKGAKILHPEAMLPVSTKKIPVWIKNTFKPDFIGTKIWKDNMI